MKRVIPSVEEIVQSFVDNRTQPIIVDGKVKYQGDVFYSDISYLVRTVYKLKHGKAEIMFQQICAGLRAKNFWVHS
jgi:hypothetical protein